MYLQIMSTFHSKSRLFVTDLITLFFCRFIFHVIAHKTMVFYVFNSFIHFIYVIFFLNVHCMFLSSDVK